MKHHVFSATPNTTFQVAILSKSTAFNKAELTSNYVDPLVIQGLSRNNIVAFTLKYNEAGKAPVKHIKEYLEFLLPALTSLSVEYLYVADTNYFKALTGQTKAESHHGYIMPCKVANFTHLKIVLGINYQQLIYDPELRAKLDRGIDAVASSVNGTYQPPGTGIIHSAQYPDSVAAIATWLNDLHQYPELNADIEAFSLRFYEAGIGTMGFSWDQHNGGSFPCDYKPLPQMNELGHYGENVPNPAVRALLKQFLTEYQGKLVWHNASYDLKVLIYVLWMKSLDDTEGLLEGLEVMTRLFDDTKIITYLATNTTAGNVLGLKPNAHEFAGNWAQEEIKDIRKIPLPTLLQYNLVDCLSTGFTKAKNYPIMVADKQEDIYRTIMLPSVKTLLQTELTGMPMSADKIDEIEVKLSGIDAKFRKQVMAHPKVAEFEAWKTKREWDKDFADRKAKAKNPDKIQPKDWDSYPSFVFNPGSGPQLQILLFEMLGLPVLDKTDTGQPSTGELTLEKLLDHPVGQANKDLLEGLIGISQVSTILSTFVPAFKRAIAKDPSGIVWLFGSFNIGGTVSGRLSSSDPKQHWASQK